MPSPSPPPWTDLIERALQLAPSQRALAARLHMNASHFSRVRHGARLSVANCLRLADLLGEDPAVVLRTFNYHTEAAILERAYPKRGRRARADVTLLTDAAKLPPERLKLIRELIAALGPRKRKR